MALLHPHSSWLNGTSKITIMQQRVASAWAFITKIDILLGMEVDMGWGCALLHECRQNIREGYVKVM